MNTKQIKGTTNAAPVLTLNKAAAIGGIKAPPTIDMIINEEANLLPSPKSLQASAKMVGNMIDWKKYTIMSATTANTPPPMIAMTSETTAPIEYMPNILLEACFPMK